MSTRITSLETENEGKDRVIVRLVIALAIMGLSVIGYIAVKISR
jgi:hypothetical protein